MLSTILYISNQPIRIESSSNCVSFPPYQVSFPGSPISSLIPRFPYIKSHSQAPLYQVSFQGSPISSLIPRLSHIKSHSKALLYQVSFPGSPISSLIPKLPHIKSHSQIISLQASKKESVPGNETRIFTLKV